MIIRIGTIFHPPRISRSNYTQPIPKFVLAHLLQWHSQGVSFVNEKYSGKLYDQMLVFLYLWPASCCSTDLDRRWHNSDIYVTDEHIPPSVQIGIFACTNNRIHDLSTLTFAPRTKYQIISSPTCTGRSYQNGRTWKTNSFADSYNLRLPELPIGYVM